MVQNPTSTAHKVQTAVLAGGDGTRLVRALVLTGFGINCEEEVAAAYRLAGAEATIAHLNEVLHGTVSIHDFDTLNFPGGFSFGDDLGSGVVLANKLRYRRLDAQGRTLLDDIKQFIANGKFVLGICNGFQVLVKLGLLPNRGGDVTPEVTLTHNASGRYENRWVRLRVNPAARTPFLRGLDTLEVPVRHGEGRLVLPNPATGEALMAAGLNCLTYVDAAGDGTFIYPLNPNGADLNCAGLCDLTGQVFGLMPHPEAFLSLYNHPEWRRKLREGAGEEGEGLAIFRNIVGHIAGLGNHSPLAAPWETPPPSPLPDGEGGLVSSFSTATSTDSSTSLELEASSPSPSGRGLGGGVSQAVEEPRPHYARRQQPAPELTSIPDNVFTAPYKQWERTKPLARTMRQAPTPAENALWQALRGQQLGVKFRRQHAIDSFIVDFVSLPDKLIIEVDGGIHDQPEQTNYDAGRTEILNELGYKVIRFSNQAVLERLPVVLHQIQATLTQSAETFK